MLLLRVLVRCYWFSSLLLGFFFSDSYFFLLLISRHKTSIAMRDTSMCTSVNILTFLHYFFTIFDSCHWGKSEVNKGSTQKTYFIVHLKISNLFVTDMLLTPGLHLCQGFLRYRPCWCILVLIGEREFRCSHWKMKHTWWHHSISYHNQCAFTMFIW